MEIKQQPQNLEIEKLIIGAILIDRYTHDKVIPLLEDESFYDLRHIEIFKAMRELYEQHKAIDPETVVERLKFNDKLDYIGGAYYIVSLTHNVGMTTNVMDWVEIIVNKAIRRDIIKIATEYAGLAYDDNPTTKSILDEFQAKALMIGSIMQSSKSKSITEILKEVTKRSLLAKENKAKLLGIPSGLKEVDRLINGWQAPDLVILAARPAMGKTSMMLAFAKNSGLRDKSAVGVFSLEMGATQLGTRVMSGEIERSAIDINKGLVSEADLLKAESVYLDAPIFIDDTPGLSIMELRSKARQMVKNSGVKMIFIDYLQLMMGSGKRKGGNREQEIAEIARGLKITAKELNIPIIALAQLSRACEARKDKRPMLSDLRESGAIEQDADIVIFLYSDEVYGINEDEDGNSTKDVVEVLIRKHRNGATGIVKVGFKRETTTFYNLKDQLVDYPEAEWSPF